MRTESQIKRKQNELRQQQQTLITRLEQSESNEAREALKDQNERLADRIDLLEWVLNEPLGSYHA
ncbi:hypothetical protein GK047_09710 [Paenibacillus sp. SYP-B3998]|uniref:Uncharacterized protein n=1 Tax=Paenibacillus sp. SYP-B3998 TaxID=2678564 RepID=A0A6G3ZY02_9BACL|nr:hypothetical protein [Paenibacillus sp. SYP-B3998]NEW06287.1 hypothetical protein [Paenibacillus sp. SYP-B3998]